MADEAPPPLMPELRQRVHIRLGRWAVSLPTIVEDVLEQELLVGAPLDLVEGQEPAAGERLQIMWEDIAGPHTLPGSFSAVVPRELPQWRIKPDGLVRSDQRRRHVRAATEGSMTVVRDQEAYTATLLDLSEGGLRCRLERADALAGVGDLVSCILKIGLRELDVRGRVNQVHLDLGAPRVLAISLVDLTQQQSDELRRHVFAEQARARSHSAR